VIMIIASFLLGKDCDPIEVDFECKVWQPPRGGSDCEECNGDPLKPCSEYRCESLGASCELLNYDAESEGYYMCVDAGVGDVGPPQISPMTDLISPNLKYSNINEGGFDIVSDSGGCVNAYTPLVFGINTDEPALCKMDIEMKEFDEMSFDMGGNFYLLNHTTGFTLPDPSHGQSQGPGWDGELTLYVKCSDSAGNENPGFYTIDMCVEEGPDDMAPTVSWISPPGGSLVSFNATEEFVEIATYEYATCKWDAADVSYVDMANTFECGDSFGGPSSVYGYVCSSNFPITENENQYFIKCADQPWLVGTENESRRNFAHESLRYVLKKPESKISIQSILPAQDFEIASEPTSINLEVQTAGGGEYHFCSYSFSGYDTMIPFFETGTDRNHIQPAINLNAGEWTIYVECNDETEDSVRGETSFEIIYDDAAPTIARVWNDHGEIFVITTEESECKYGESSCHFNWEDATTMGEGIIHAIDATPGGEYFIKCKDDFGNVPSACSIVVRAI